MDKYFLIAILAALGFSVAAYIRYKKSRGESLVCYLGDDCNKVVFSSYSTLLGVPNELIGMVYFAAMSIASMTLFMAPDINTTIIQNSFTLAVSLAASFSVILVLIQIFKLKEFCEWCLSTAVLSILIAVLILL